MDHEFKYNCKQSFCCYETKIKLVLYIQMMHPDTVKLH